MDKLRDKVIVLTGASEGIGRALAKELARPGNKLALAARDEERLQSLKEEVEAKGAEALVVPTDITDENACKTLIDRAVEEFGRLDVLINNAGMTLWTMVDDIEDLSIFERIMRVNYLGAVYCTAYALPHLKKTKGRIVGVSSSLGLLPAPTHSAYCGSKYAMFGFFDTLRIEIKKTGVTVTMIAPGFVKTEIHNRALDRHGKPLGKSPVEKDIYMSAEKAATMIAGAIEKRKRLLVMDVRIKIARFLHLIMPGTIESIMEREFEDATGGKTF